ncbi:MAG: Glu-tRNA(Gln) amidotransferase subunit GatD [Methanobacteriota archaeon]|nr:MAG: Glu-tRNA(Gln) amidotransferase subunit GatD [Euryarchaeota archaeon]
MDYPPRVRALLDRAQADGGDTVVVRAKGERYEGTLMPHHGFSGEDILTVKLPSGYNIGIAVGDIDAVEVTAKHEATRAERRLPPPTKDKLTVAVLGTGGTIASYVDYRTGAVHPAVTAEELVFSVPELLEVCNVRARVIYSIFSENLKPENWQHLAREVAKELSSGAAGVIIPQGTDTLHFTTAALSFMVRDLTGPVVVVGAQRSSDRPSSDSALNLLSAAHVSVANLGEVVAVMHGETSDTFGQIHRGTKVRKMHSSRRDAFRSLNATPLGRVHPDGTVELTDRALPRARGPTKVDDALETKVALVTFYPGQRPTELEAILQGLRGIVIAGTGLGHVAHDLIPILHRATRDGVAVVMTTQTLQGRVSMRVYDTGRDLLKAGVIEGQDMTPETAYVKLMWVLGHTRDHAEVASAMATNVAGEINPRIGLDEFAE